MIYIFVPMHAEAAPLIRLLHLKKEKGPGSVSCYADDGTTVLAETGTGMISAAASAAAVLARYDAGSRDIAVMYGSAAGVSLAEKSRLYEGIKLKNNETGMDFYPDPVTRTDLEKAILVSGEKLYEGGEISCVSKYDRTLPVLYDMESSAFFQAASLFLSVHQTAVLRFVSDTGCTENLTASGLSAVSEKNAEAAVSCMHRMQERILLPEEKDDPDGAEWMNRMLCGSETMKRQIHQVIRYCICAGIDWRKEAQRLAEEKVIPCSSREEGKKVLYAFREKLCG